MLNVIYEMEDKTFKNYRHLFKILCISLVLNLVVCEDYVDIFDDTNDDTNDDVNDVDYLDMDYLAEEAAKETLLKNELHDFAFSGRRNYGLTSEIMWMNTPIWSDFWSEWKQKKITVLNSITDVIPLCKLPKSNKILVDCNSTSSSIYTCVDAEKGTISKCNSSKNAAYSVPLCMERASRKIVACGKIATAYLCIPNITSTNSTKTRLKLYPIRPCHHERRQICLKKDGLLDLCEGIYNATLGISTPAPSKSKNKMSEIYTEFKDLDEWWKEWNISTNTPNIGGILKSINRLCQLEDEEEYLLECKASSNLLEVCIEARTGKIKQCSNIKKKDMPISVCIEPSLKKITTCKEDGFAFLCLSAIQNTDSIVPCRERHRHICLNNGSVVLCSPEKQTSNSDRFTDSQKASKRNVTDDLDLYKEAFQVKNMKSRSKEMQSEEMVVGDKENETLRKTFGSGKMQIPICRSKPDRNRVVYCTNTLADEEICISAKHNTIGSCISYKTDDDIMPVCVEEKSKKIVICDHEFSVAYLCFEIRPQKRKKYFVYPCTFESQMRCLNEKGKLAKCAVQTHQASEEWKIFEQFLKNVFQRTKRSITKPTDIPESIDYKSLKATTKPFPWIMDRIPIPGRYDKFSERLETVLCMFEGSKNTLIPCDDDFSIMKACVNLKLGEIVNCQTSDVSHTTLVICVENSSNKLKICEDSLNSFLCFDSPFNYMKNKNLLSLCNDEERHVCLDKNEGIMHYCSIFTLRRSLRESPDEHSSDENFWISFWMEWAHPQSEYKIKDPELSVKLLCLTETNNLVECYSRNVGVRACVSASYSYVDRCKDLSESEKAVPICMERHSEKLITCGKFPRAYLCYPSNGHLKPKQPCHDKSRHICYTDGFIQNCLIADFYKIRRENHRKIKKAIAEENSTLTPYANVRNNTYSLMRNLKTEARKESIQNPPKKIVFLCELNNGKIGECQENITEHKLCLSLILQKIGICNDDENTPFVRICKEVSTSRIVPCDSAIPFYICVDDNNKYSIMHTCNSTTHYICLSKDKGITSCMEVTKIAERSPLPQESLENNSQTQLIQANTLSMKLLCSADDNRLVECVHDPYNLVMCLNTREWILQPCEDAEENSEIGIPVCMQPNTSYLMTCGILSHDHLCFSNGKNKPILIPCKVNSSMACVNSRGELIECSEKFNSLKFNSFENKEKTVKFKWIFERLFEGIEHLCFVRYKSMLTICLVNDEQYSACFMNANGIIAPCDQTTPGLLPIPLCREINTNKLVTCGKFNRVNICINENDSSIYSPCSDEEKHACFEEMEISKCSSNKPTIKKIRSVASDAENNALDIHNRRKVHPYEFERLERMLEGTMPLCIKDSLLVLCANQSDITLACFGDKDGEIKSCDNFSKADDVAILHLDINSKIVKASRKFFKSNICFIPESPEMYICSQNNNVVCLKNGSIIMCKSELTDNKHLEEYEKHVKSEEDLKVKDGLQKVLDKLQFVKSKSASLYEYDNGIKIKKNSRDIETLEYEKNENKNIDNTELEKKNVGGDYVSIHKNRTKREEEKLTASIMYDDDYSDYDSDDDSSDSDSDDGYYYDTNDDGFDYNYDNGGKGITIVYEEESLRQLNCEKENCEIFEPKAEKDKGITVINEDEFLGHVECEEGKSEDCEILVPKEEKDRGITVIYDEKFLGDDCEEGKSENCEIKETEEEKDSGVTVINDEESFGQVDCGEGSSEDCEILVPKEEKDRDITVIYEEVTFRDDCKEGKSEKCEILETEAEKDRGVTEIYDEEGRLGQVECEEGSSESCKILEPKGRKDDILSEIVIQYADCIDGDTAKCKKTPLKDIKDRILSEIVIQYADCIAGDTEKCKKVPPKEEKDKNTDCIDGDKNCEVIEPTEKKDKTLSEIIIQYADCKDGETENSKEKAPLKGKDKILSEIVIENAGSILSDVDTEDYPDSALNIDKEDYPDSASNIDEKFIRLTCKNCTVHNTLVVVGTPADVLPEAEVITFAP